MHFEGVASISATPDSHPQLLLSLSILSFVLSSSTQLPFMQRQMAWLCSLPTSATRRRLPLLFLSWSKALVPQSRAQSPKQRASRRCAAAACASQLAHAPARHSVARHAFKTTSFAGAWAVHCRLLRTLAKEVADS
jgi:hypothetical protein